MEKKLKGLNLARTFEAQRMGHLLPAEQLPEDLFKSKISEQVKLDAMYDKKITRVRAKLSKSVGLELSGRRVYIDKAGNAGLNFDKIKSNLVAKGAIIDPERSGATVWVVDDVLHPGQRNQWLASLLGGCLLSTRFVLTGDGPWMKLQAAMAVRRLVYISSKFNSVQPGLNALIQHCGRTLGSRCQWTFLKSLDDFKAKSKSKTGARRHFYALALVTTAERQCSSQDGWEAVDVQ